MSLLEIARRYTASLNGTNYRDESVIPESDERNERSPVGVTAGDTVDPYLGPDSIIVPANGWRGVVATWKPIRWRTWHDLALALMPLNATASEIVTAQYQAFVELASVYELNHVDHDTNRLISSFDPKPDPQANEEADAIRFYNAITE